MIVDRATVALCTPYVLKDSLIFVFNEKIRKKEKDAFSLGAFG